MIGLRRTPEGAKPLVILSHQVGLWQDAGKTTPGAINSPVGNWQSLRNGYEATQSNAAAKPTLLADGLSFDGGDTLEIPTVSALNWGSGPFTVKFWAYATANTGTILCLASNASTYAALAVYSGALYMANVGGTSYTVNGLSMGSFSASEWTHHAVTRDAAGQLTTWKNGLAHATMTFTGQMPFSLSNLSHIASNRSQYFWSGRITDINIYVGACRYTTTFTPPARSGS